MVCRRRSCAATSAASGASSSRVAANSAKPSVTARDVRRPDRAISPTQRAESIPAERKTPTGTSATRWWRTLSAARRARSAATDVARAHAGAACVRASASATRSSARLARAQSSTTHAARRQRADLAVEGERLGHAAPEVETRQARRLGSARHARRPRAAPSPATRSGTSSRHRRSRAA